MRFWELTVPSSAETSDALTNFLWERGALGVVEEETAARPLSLRAFFPETGSSTALMASVAVYRDSLRALGFSVSGDDASIAPLLDGDWARAWRESFTPVPVGERLLVIPPWEARDGDRADGRLRVVIEPGRAFGTGHHGSTAGCLTLLERALSAADSPPPPLVDVGTGTGILAIAALVLGAPSAVAIDVDPDAISAARLNAETNGCADRLALALEGPDELLARGPFPLVVANLLTHTHLALAGRYARLVTPGGRLVLGGILADEADRVRDAVREAGFTADASVVLDGWASLLFSRPSSPYQYGA